MTRSARSPLGFAAAALACLALAACGSGSDAKLLPGNTAQEINENLDTVRQLVSEGECVGAGDAALQVSTQVEALQGIDPKLKEALEKGAARLNEVVAECEAEPAEESVEAETSPEAEEAEEEAKKVKKTKEAAEEAAPEEEAKQPAEPEAQQPQGEAKGNPHTPAPAEESAPSGGIGPGSPAGEGG